MHNVVKVIESGYESPQALAALLKYVFNDKRTNRFCCYCGGANISPYTAESEMQYIKNYYRKKEGRQARHFIISLGEYSEILPYEANQLALQVCEYYSDRFQIVYSVHEDTENLHIHFVLNTVSFVDGKMFSESTSELHQFKNYVNSIIKNFSNTY